MRKLIPATAALICLLGLSVCAALAQEDTPTNTRRATPTSTPTRTETVPVSPSSTPTLPMGGTDTFLCSRGANDGHACDLDEDCPDGACVLPQGVCSGGSEDGAYCTETAECDGGSCLLTQRVCLSGNSKGVSCIRDEQCPDSSCVSSGLFCDGGDFDLFSCIDDTSCVGTLSTGVCVAPTVRLCSGGSASGAPCRSHLDCPSGACVIAQGLCVGGDGDGATCEGDIQCPGGTCEIAATICNAGENVAVGCLSNTNCPGGACVATGKVCSGGDFDSVSCVDNASCSPAGGEAGTCGPPEADFYCSGGENDGLQCADDEDCAGGSCVFSQGVCDGGADDGSFCETSADCAGSVPCLQTQKVCLAGDLAGFSCLDNAQCGSGVLCGSSGLFCEGGDFDRFSCVTSDNCCDAEGCNGGDEDGACRSTDLFLCSGGSKDSNECGSHFDCPGGACVLAQKVCDGGDDDGFGCEGNVNCSGNASCTATSKICSGGDDDSFGCLRSSQCRGSGNCVATGQVCDGGDVLDDEYDAFSLFYSCTNDESCGDDTLSCVSPTSVGLACSAGSHDGQACTFDTQSADCPDGVCVVQDSLCEGGDRDAALCDTSADCPDGACRATQRVCSGNGFSCVSSAQCDAPETCISSGRVCAGSAFGAFSCADDSNCYNPDDPDSETGACVGVTPRACSLEAPCVIEGQSVGEVFGFSINPLTSPATFDFYLVPIATNAVGTVVVLRPSGGDADLYVGRNVNSQIYSAEEYPFASNFSDDTTDFIRISPQSSPTFTVFASGIDEYAATVAGIGGETSYTIEALSLGGGIAGDGNCDGSVDADDVDGIEAVIFDPAARLTEAASPFGRCIGGDPNLDGSETAADLIGTVREIAAP